MFYLPRHIRIGYKFVEIKVRKGIKYRKINSLFDNGDYIIIYTARYMGFASGNVKKAEKYSTRSATENPGKMSLFLRILKYEKFYHKYPAFGCFVCVKIHSIHAFFLTFSEAYYQW